MVVPTTIYDGDMNIEEYSFFNMRPTTMKTQDCGPLFAWMLRPVPYYGKGTVKILFLESDPLSGVETIVSLFKTVVKSAESI